MGSCGEAGINTLNTDFERRIMCVIECVRVTYHVRWLRLASAHSSVRSPGFTSRSAPTDPDDAPSDKSWGKGGGVVGGGKS